MDPDPTTDAAYAAYVAQSWTTLVRTAVFLGARPHEAEDVAQTTLVRCYTGWDRVSAADDRDAYVYRMLLNCLHDLRRTRWFRDRQYDDPDALSRAEQDRSVGTRGDDDAERIAVADAVHRALGTLSRPNRDVVVLRYFAQLSERQTAEVLGIAPGTVKSRLSRALTRLAASDHLLEESGGTT